MQRKGWQGSFPNSIDFLTLNILNTPRQLLLGLGKDLIRSTKGNQISLPILQTDLLYLGKFNSIMIYGLPKKEEVFSVPNGELLKKYQL